MKVDYYYLAIYLLICYLFVAVINDNYRVKNLKYPYFLYLPNTTNNFLNPIIYTLAYGYTWEKIKLFVVSLRNNGYNGDLVIAMSNKMCKSMTNIISKYSFKIILVDNEYPYYSRKNTIYHIDNSVLKKCSLKNRKSKYKWYLYRHSLLYCWIIVYGKKYSHILVTDIRDVVFQGNPFNWNIEDGVYLIDETLDNIYIKDSMCNLKWVRCFANYQSIINNKILNGGTMLGSRQFKLCILFEIF